MNLVFSDLYPETAREEIRRYYAFGKAVCDVNKVPELAKNVDLLKDEVRLFYKMLFFRSKYNKGFTRLYTSEFAKVLNISVRTLQRWLAYMENLGLITRLTHREKISGNRYKSYCIVCVPAAALLTARTDKVPEFKGAKGWVKARINELLKFFAKMFDEQFKVENQVYFSDWQNKLYEYGMLPQDIEDFLRDKEDLHKAEFKNDKLEEREISRWAGTYMEKRWVDEDETNNPHIADSKERQKEIRKFYLQDRSVDPFVYVGTDADGNDITEFKPLTEEEKKELEELEGDY